MTSEEITVWFEEVLIPSLPPLEELLREEVERICSENMGLVYIPTPRVEYTSYVRQLTKCK